jgi:hypothetical protein
MIYDGYNLTGYPYTNQTICLQTTNLTADTMSDTLCSLSNSDFWIVDRVNGFNTWNALADSASGIIGFDQYSDIWNVLYGSNNLNSGIQTYAIIYSADAK